MRPKVKIMEKIRNGELFVIEGGKRLKGKVKINGAKNAALPIIAAALLADSPSVIENVPKLLDIYTMIEVISHLGAKVEFSDDGKLSINPINFDQYIAPYELVKKMRASILVMGPLLAKLGKAKISLPGGCAIGPRPVDLHLSGFKILGADVNFDKGYIYAEVNRFKGNYIYLDFPSVGATENIMMAASLAEGETIIENAAREPEVVDLGDFLKKMGADIDGVGSDLIRIKGVKNLNGVSSHKVISDRIEAGTFMIAGAITKGDIVLEDINPEFLHAVIVKLKNMGLKVYEYKDSVRVMNGEYIQGVDIKTMPYPGFPTDMQAQMMSLLSVSNGISIVTENIFENRFTHVGELKRMGADIRIEGHSAIIKGVERLSGAEVTAHDLRAGASLIIAGLASDGITRVNGVYHIDRGYENIEEKLNALGASIKRVKTMEEKEV